jgi:hypothetical protein
MIGKELSEEDDQKSVKEFKNCLDEAHCRMMSRRETVHRLGSKTAIEIDL